MYLIKELEIIEVGINQYIIINLINGNADIIDKDLYQLLKNNNVQRLTVETTDALIQRKYLFRNIREYREYLEEFNNKLANESLKEPPNFIIIPTFDCNLKCYYCYQKAYEMAPLNFENVRFGNQINKLFDSIESMIVLLEKENRTKYNRNEINITLTGGEPLMIEHRHIIKEIFKNANNLGYELSIVTNGTTLEHYYEDFEKFQISNIQITVDGSQHIHDNIRITKNGLPTYEIIINNIKLLSKISDNISVRINVSYNNLHLLSDLNDLIISLPNVFFYIYIMQQEGCYDYKNIIPEINALKNLHIQQHELLSNDNLIVEYHGRNLVEGIFFDRPFSPKIKVCSAMQNQFIMDFRGGIYKCWWGMGSQEYLVGHVDDNFIPKLDSSRINVYQRRNVIHIHKCSTCNYRYICGGGCSGRITRADLQKSKVICPEFKKIFNFVIPFIWKSLNQEC